MTRAFEEMLGTLEQLEQVEVEGKAKSKLMRRLRSLRRLMPGELAARLDAALVP